MLMEFFSEGMLVIGLLIEWMCGNEVEICFSDGDMGGIMCLGVYLVVLGEGMWVCDIYGVVYIEECYCYCYEVNVVYCE